MQETQNSQNNIEKDKAETLTLLNSKIYNSNQDCGTDIRIDMDWWNRTENPEINAYF